MSESESEREREAKYKELEYSITYSVKILYCYPSNRIHRMKTVKEGNKVFVFPGSAAEASNFTGRQKFARRIRQRKSAHRKV